MTFFHESMKTHKLVREDGTEVKVGDTITSFRGEDAKVEGYQVGWHPGSTGRVFVGGGTGYYPSVYGLSIVEREPVA